MSQTSTSAGCLATIFMAVITFIGLVAAGAAFGLGLKIAGF